MKSNPEAPPRKARATTQKGLRPSSAARLRNYFLTGILVTAPISITIWLAWKMVSFIDRQVAPLIPPRWDPESYLPFAIPGTGIVIAVIALTLIGFVTTGYLGRLITSTSERLIARLPVVSSVYGWIRQVFETVLSQKSNAFRDVVMIEYPCRDSWAIGFITGQTEGEVQGLTAEVVYNVFVPATPNPTTGFLLFIPERDIHRLDMTVEDGLKLVISGGIVTPQDQREAKSDWRWSVTPQELLHAKEREEAMAKGIDFDSVRASEKLEAETKAKEEAEAHHRRSLIGRFRTYLITGTLVTAPIAITVWLAWEFISYMDDQITPLIPSRWNPETYLPFGLPGLGLVVAVGTMITIGFMTHGIIGRAIVRMGERLLDRLPVIRGIYSAVKQIFESILKKQSKAFRQVVLIEYPRPESWAIGFLTGDSIDQVRGNTGETAVNVFLPTTPNPTSGFLLFLRHDQVRSLVMTVEQGIKMVVSGGIVTPPAPPSQNLDQQREETINA